MRVRAFPESYPHFARSTIDVEYGTRRHGSSAYHPRCAPRVHSLCTPLQDCTPLSPISSCVAGDKSKGRKNKGTPGSNNKQRAPPSAGGRKKSRVEEDELSS